MTNSEIPIQSQPARFRLGGAGRGQGIVLLYQDKLAAVSTRAELWGILLGPFVLAAATYPLIHDLGALGGAVGVLAGGWIGRAIDKGWATGKVARGGGGVTVLPLDVVASVQTRKSPGIFSWLSGQALLVTTVDGAEYQFRGRMSGWQSDLASALTVRGREVRVTPEGIAVTPQAVRNED